MCVKIFKLFAARVLPCTVGPLLSAELDYPRFLKPKFGTANLYEVH